MDKFLLIGYRNGRLLAVRLTEPGDTARLDGKQMPKQRQKKHECKVKSRARDVCYVYGVTVGERGGNENS